MIHVIMYDLPGKRDCVCVTLRINRRRGRAIATYRPHSNNFIIITCHNKISQPVDSYSLKLAMHICTCFEAISTSVAQSLFCGGVAALLDNAGHVSMYVL